MQMALSALHRPQGLEPSHLEQSESGRDALISNRIQLTLDFLNLQRSQALQTLLRTLSGCEWSDIGDDCRAVMVYTYYYQDDGVLHIPIPTSWISVDRCSSDVADYDGLFWL